jgi:DNA processing protein
LALHWQETHNHHLIHLNHAQYPLLLTECYDPPPLLFAKGDITLFQPHGIAMVGSRHASPQAKQTTAIWANHLASQGFVIISGLAEGIDTAAHQGALQNQGKTIAVLGTGIDRVYPAHNRELAHQIAEQGLLLSEFPLDTRPHANNFPRRNRIIAALSQATLVMEAALASGSLITARLANEMGKEVFAMPGSIHNAQSKGCHQLIKAGAKLLESVHDIFEEMPYLTSAVTISTSSACSKNTTPKTQQSPIFCPDDLKNDGEYATLNKMGFDPIHPDELLSIIGIDMVCLQGHLLQLELDGKIVALTGGKFQRISTNRL